MLTISFDESALVEETPSDDPVELSLLPRYHRYRWIYLTSGTCFSPTLYHFEPTHKTHALTTTGQNKK